MTPRILRIPRPEKEDPYVVMINDGCLVQTLAEKLIAPVIANSTAYIYMAHSGESPSINLAEMSFKELSGLYPYLAVSVLGWGMIHSYDGRVDKVGPDDLLVNVFQGSRILNELNLSIYENTRIIYQRALPSINV